MFRRSLDFGCSRSLRLVSRSFCCQHCLGLAGRAFALGLFGRGFVRSRCGVIGPGFSFDHGQAVIPGFGCVRWRFAAIAFAAFAAFIRAPLATATATAAALFGVALCINGAIIAGFAPRCIAAIIGIFAIFAAFAAVGAVFGFAFAFGPVFTLTATAIAASAPTAALLAAGGVIFAFAFVAAFTAAAALAMLGCFALFLVFLELVFGEVFVLFLVDDRFKFGSL